MRMGLQPKTLEVRDLGFRWGSCGRAGGLNFDWATILLPARVVEYIIVHEMIHLREHHHTPKFWLRRLRLRVFEMTAVSRRRGAGGGAPT